MISTAALEAGTMGFDHGDRFGDDRFRDKGGLGSGCGPFLLVFNDRSYQGIQEE